MKVVRFEVIDSTSLHSRREIEAGRGVGEPTLYVAVTQTGGVGRHGRAFACPAGGLWCTLVWPLSADGLERAAALDGLGLRVGVACLRTIDEVTQGVVDVARVKLKWPNDVLIGGRKVLGVLTEVVSHRGAAWALVGTGINADFEIGAMPESLRGSATTLRDETKQRVDVAALEACLMKNLSGALGSAGLGGGTLEAARARLHGVGARTRVETPAGEAWGELTGLDEGGLPIVLDNRGARLSVKRLDPIGA